MAFCVLSNISVGVNHIERGLNVKNTASEMKTQVRFPLVNSHFFSIHSAALTYLMHGLHVKYMEKTKCAYDKSDANFLACKLLETNVTNTTQCV